MPVHFAFNRSSWNEADDLPLPGSMAHLIADPIMRALHSDHGIMATVGRQGREGAINLYSSSRTAYDKATPGGERSILISHGIADKGIRGAIGGDFGYVVAPSPRIAEDLTRRGINPRRLAVLGYPKLDPIFNGQLEPLPRDERIRVLYAPTQGGGGEDHMDDKVAPNISAALRSSWWRRREILDLLDPEVFDVVECHHPRYTPGHVATLRQYVGADVVIADGGSTLWEALALDLPLVLPSWITRFGFDGLRTLEARLYHQNIGRHADRPQDLVPLLLQAAQEGPTGAEQLESHLALPPDLRGVGGKLHADYVAKVGRDMLR